MHSVNCANVFLNHSMFRKKRWKCRDPTIPEPLQGLHVSGLFPGGTPVPPEKKKKKTVDGRYWREGRTA